MCIFLIHNVEKSEMLSLKRVLLVNLAQKGISILAVVTVMDELYLYLTARFNCGNFRLAKLSFERHSSYHSPVGGNPL